MEHTGEPWVTDGRRVLAQPEKELGEFELCLCSFDADDSPIVGHQITEEEAEANAQRIADCVTACKGLNPRNIPEAFLAFRAALDWWHSIPGHMQQKEPAWVAQARETLYRVSGLRLG